MARLECLVSYTLADMVAGRNMVVALGRKSSGKSTLGADLEGLGWESRSFAAPLKALAGRWFYIPSAVLNGPSSAREATLNDALGAPVDWRRVWQRATAPDELDYIQALFRCAPHAMGLVLDGLRNQFRRLAATPDLTVRQVLQVVGTDWGRALDTDVWVRAAMDEAAASQALVVFTDGRFRNEALAGRHRGALVVYLDPGDRVPCPAVRHPSEPTLADIGADAVDVVVDTSGDTRVWRPVTAPGTIPA